MSLSAIALMSAQSRPRGPTNGSQAVFALDTWVVSRYRNAQLLPDSLVGRMASGEEPAPRVESVSDAPTGDTLFALEFRTRRETSSLRTGSRVRLAEPTGSITTITADIMARRPFRAPRRPGADTSTANWRYGWVYLAIVRRQHAATPAPSYRGWLLLAGPDSLRRP